MDSVELTDKDQKMRLSVAVARLFVGLKEFRGNRGPMIEKFQKAVDGKAHGEAWCMSFTQYCVKQADEMFDFMNLKTSGDRVRLYPTEHVLTCWNKSQPDCRMPVPEIGAWLIWAQIKGDKETGSGHVEIVSEVLPGSSVMVIGGNTSAPQDGTVEREGDGVWEKKRDLSKNYGSMRLKGILKPW